MSTRTLTPSDPNRPDAGGGGSRGGRGARLATLVAAVGGGLVVLGFAAAGVLEEEGPLLLSILGVAVLALALVVGAVVRWGPSAILLILGLPLILAGIAGLVTVNAVEETATTLYAGDDDGDGLTDEDDHGDTDDSANDPTQVDGLEELMEPDDDDSDGQVDEDPAPVIVHHTEAQAAFRIGRDVSLGLAAIGLVLSGFFFALQNMDARRDERA